MLIEEIIIIKLVYQQLLWICKNGVNSMYSSLFIDVYIVKLYCGDNNGTFK